MYFPAWENRFNQMDSRAALVLHSRMGIGADAIDRTACVRRHCRGRSSGRALKLENLAEELRVLYVAMTRPKEKLIMIAHGIEAGEPCKTVRHIWTAGRNAVVSNLKQRIRLS